MRVHGDAERTQRQVLKPYQTVTMSWDYKDWNMLGEIEKITFTNTSKTTATFYLDDIGVRINKL